MRKTVGIAMGKFVIPNPFGRWEVALPVVYAGIRLEAGLRLDFSSQRP